MEAITKDMRKQLRKPIDKKYLKPHPTKKTQNGPMTVIHPMGVIERLNDVFGVGMWTFTVREIGPVRSWEQATRKGSRAVFSADAVGHLKLPSGTIIEQFGGSTNDDSGDALKGAATDALTKCASYLEIGFNIYSGQADAKTPEPAAKNPATKKQREMIANLMLERQLKPGEFDKLNAALGTMDTLTAAKTIETLTRREKTPQTAAVDMLAPPVIDEHGSRIQPEDFEFEQ